MHASWIAPRSWDSITRWWDRKATASHPDARPLGWEAFASLIADRPMPVYAIGGLKRSDLAQARRRGAHGVALLSAAFE